MIEKPKFDYFYGAEAETYSFYRIPKILFTNQIFKSLSCEAKLLYGLMLDRMTLSIKNQWLDQENKVYIIFTVEDVIEQLGCARQKAVKLLAELDSEHGIGLIEKKRRGLGKPSIIYVKNFMLICQEKEEDSAEFPNSYYKKYGNHTSGSMKSKSFEVPESNFNKTNNNKTDYNDKNHRSSVRNDSTEYWRMMIRNNIEYEILCQTHERSSIDEIVELMVEVMCSRKNEIAVNGELVSIEAVKSRFMKINFDHIEYIFECMESTKNKIHNIRQYLLTVIYNAPVTMNHYYKAEVNFDKQYPL